jgi:hypothetical protein
MVQLAEYILNLNDVSGVSSCMAQIRHGNIESGYAELQAGRILKRHNVKFGYVVPTKRKGHDFDLKIVMKNELLLASDVKCKIEGGSFSESGIINALDKARRNNISKEYAAGIFLKLPDSWWEGDIREEVKNICKQYINLHLRVASIVVFGSHEVREGESVRTRHHFIETAQFVDGGPSSEDFRILCPGGQVSETGPWVDIAQI